MTETVGTTKATGRFEQKRQAIIESASALINEHGVRGMGFAEVADHVGLTTTSVTYYFRKKDDLACACLLRSLDHMDEQVALASVEADAVARIGRLARLHLDQARDIRLGKVAPFARLSDIRAMNDPMRAELLERYRGVFRGMRALLGEGGGDKAHGLRSVRAHVLIEILLWTPAWIDRYSLEDFDRVYRRMMEVFVHGLTPEGHGWRPAALPDPGIDDDDGPARRNFLMAATRLINDRGYRGASVERIASELNVTKGSFYHHLNAKDDLVLECFRRSLTTVTEAQRAAGVLPGTYLERLQSTVASLLAYQFSDNGPLLRTTALQAIPPAVRRQVMDHSNTAAGRFADLMIDGISEQSLRPVDPLIASQMLMAAINAAYEQRRWVEEGSIGDSVATYASTIFEGLAPQS
jgi:AcrR family transcriptional regulator